VFKVRRKLACWILGLGTAIGTIGGTTLFAWAILVFAWASGWQVPSGRELQWLAFHAQAALAVSLASCAVSAVIAAFVAMRWKGI
jgi:hypothetical protein